MMFIFYIKRLQEASRTVHDSFQLSPANGLVSVYTQPNLKFLTWKSYIGKIISESKNTKHKAWNLDLKIP